MSIRLSNSARSSVSFSTSAWENRFPLEAIERMTLANRKIGLGVMGFAELCILLRISYASDRAKSFAEDLTAFIAREATLASARLANERGRASG